MSTAKGNVTPGRVAKNRWFVVLAAILLNLALGAIYSWPVFSSHLERSEAGHARWSHFETQLVFSMATVFLAIGVIVAGQVSERRGPRTLLLVSAIFTGAGYILGGLLPLEPLFVTLTVGAMVGFGIGAAYTLPIGLAAKWFPDRKGLVTGLAMAGFGAGSVLWSQAFDLFLYRLVGIGPTFVVYGIAFAGIILFTTLFLRDPPAGHAEALARRPGSVRVPGAQAAQAAGDGRLAPGVSGEGKEACCTRRDMAVQHQFYIIFYTLMAGSAIGLMAIGMSRSYPIERLVAAGFDPRTAVSVTRLAALVLFPIFNGGGRIVFGWLSDLLGWKPVIVLSYALQSAVLLLFPWLMGAPVTVFVGLLLMAACYGGNFTIFPIATGGLWGPAHLAANYSLVFIAFGVGALVGPSLAGAARDAGLLEAAFVLAGGALALGAILVAFVRKPARKAVPAR